MKVLITGANGQLGESFKSIERVASEQNLTLYFADRSQLDITNLNNIAQYLQLNEIDAVVNTAAYTAVDRAEGEPQKAISINEKGAKNLAQCCSEHKITLVHISTDYVFNGESKYPYCEDDEVSPLGIYGQSKYAGEQAILQYSPEAIILRTSWVFSEFGNNFLKTMLKLAQNRTELSIVSDQWGAPTYAPHIAEAVLSMLTKSEEHPKIGGIYHFSGDKKTSWCEFAKFIFSNAHAYNNTFNIPKVLPITTEQYPTAAARPPYSLLNNDKILNLCPELKRDWQRGVSLTIEALNK